MDSRSQSDSDGGGGRHGWSPPGTPHDEGRLSPQTDDGPPDPGLNNGQLPHTPPVLSLVQIQITGSTNDYTEGPTVAQRSPATQQRQQKGDLVTSQGSRTSGQQETREERPNNLRNLNSLTQHGNTSNSPRQGVLRSSSAEDSQSSIRTSVGSSSSGQRLLSSPASGDQIIRTQPKRSELNLEELKPLNNEARTVVAVPGSGANRNAGIHSSKCEDCGRCQCTECRRPRGLPSCWMCSRRCMCSAQSAVEYGTCACCIKGLFYHCSSDDEDTCADKPFSCTQSHCCIRWATVSLLSLFFPCLLCYLPAKGCVAMCQSCYDRVTRPGCRCKNSNPIHCEDVAKPT
ncbi:protein sprouty homolog 2 [Parambassis ranga]|uniref:Protein sprouty homolog 2 n=1 Tax=Parambassis ranga TaxID=210632 RepID=A0A6P7I1M1_9TELE|nr:protein sprouty homolog 2 [Parambassis ranga]